MTIKAKLSIISISLIFLMGFLPVPVRASSNPVLYSQLPNSGLTEISEEIQSAVPSVLYISDSINLQIAQQPSGNTNFVSSFPNYVTEYGAASTYGTLGLLAHNYLAGRYFFQIIPGQEVELVYSDNHTKKFIVTQIQRYQALSPNSPSSDFVDLVTGEYLTAPQLFKKVYSDQSGHLVLQTCIYADENPTWGRLFIIAEPIQ